MEKVGVEKFCEYKAKLVRHGNSLYVLVPKEVVKELGLRERDVVKVRISKFA